MKCQKHLFRLDQDRCFLNGAYMSPMLRSVEKVGRKALRQKRNPAHLTVEDFFEPQKKLKKLFSKLVNVSDYRRIAIIPSVSYGMANIINNIKSRPGQKVIIMGDQFPSNYYPWERFCQKNKLRLQIISAPTGRLNRGADWNNAILDAIDNQTVAISMAHVHWADGTIFNLKKISNRIKSMGGLLLIDGTQSLGALPFDNSIIKADAIVTTGYKWLMGPYSLGLAYMGPYFDNGIPIEESWMNRKKSDDFANLTDYQDTYRRLGKKYDVGESANFNLVPMLTRAIKQLIKWGPENIQDYCAEISKPTLKQLQESGFLIEDDNYRSAHLFGIRFPRPTDMNHLKATLEQKKIKISIRGDALRVSPNVYNDAKDLKKLKQVLLSVYT